MVSLVEVLVPVLWVLSPWVEELLMALSLVSVLMSWVSRAFVLPSL